MSKRRNLVLAAVGLGLVTLMLYQFRHSREWRQFSWQTVWMATRNARAPFILAALILALSTYFWRTWRWLALMPPGGRFWAVLRGTMIGFTGVALLGRPGEFIRPYYIARKHRSSVSPQLAVLVLERAFDMAAVVLLIGLDLAFSSQVKSLTRGTGYADAFQKAGLLLSLFVVGVLGLLYWFHRRSDSILERLRRRGIRVSSARQRLAHFLEMLAQGTVGLSDPRRLSLAILFSLINWIVVTASIWFVVHAYPAMLPGMNFAQALLLLGFTLVGAVIQLPAVGGGMQVLTLFALTRVFGADAAPAASASLLIWLISFYAIAPVGIVLAAHEGISWRQFQDQAITAEAAQEAEV